MTFYNKDIFTDAVRAVLEKQIRRREDVSGTLVGVSEIVGHIVLSFAGGKFAVYEASAGYGGDIDIELDTDQLESYDLMRAGLISQKEYNAESRASDAKQAQSCRERELETLANLMDKYGIKRGGE